MTRSHEADGIVQPLDVRREQIAFSLREINGEKVGCARDARSAITHVIGL